MSPRPRVSIEELGPNYWRVTNNIDFTKDKTFFDYQEAVIYWHEMKSWAQELNLWKAWANLSPNTYNNEV